MPSGTGFSQIQSKRHLLWNTSNPKIYPGKRRKKYLKCTKTHTPESVRHSSLFVMKNELNVIENH